MIGLLVVAAAHAGSLGVGAGIALDLPEGGNSALRTAFLPAGTLTVPIALDVSPNASLRATARGTFAVGEDLISWDVSGIGRFAESNRTLTGMASLGLGPEIRFTKDTAVVPFLAGSLGLVLVANWHADMDRPELFDPAVYQAAQLADSGTLSPYSRTVAPFTEVALGVRARNLWAEAGYDVAFIRQSQLIRGTPALNPVREAYGWNAIRLTVGYAFPIGL